MIRENDIPEYALQPAKGPELASAKGIYAVEEIFCPSETVEVRYQFEEDVLVPDIKADMAEILLLDGMARVSPREKEVIPKTDDLLNLTGELELKIIYRSTDEKDNLVSIKSRIPYKYQWNLNPEKKCLGKFSCSINQLDYTIVNERKFRIKAELVFVGVYYGSNQYQLFQGISDEELETREEKVNFTSLAMTKGDTVEIDEYFAASDREVSPESILIQDFVITENYKQVTAEKIVINGFVYCNFLYQGTYRTGDEEESVLRHHSQRVEFTQFIPIDKKQRGKKWNCCKTDFAGSNMEVSISVTEEKEYNFHVKGMVETSVDLYENLQRKVITDAYHLDKNFTCTFGKKKLFNMVALSSAETSVREIISFPKDVKVKEILFCDGKVKDCRAVCEKGRVNVNGNIGCKILWQDRDGCCNKYEETLGFRGTMEESEIEANHQAHCKCVVKNLWCELINESQMEVNIQILICGEITEEKTLMIPENPGFLSSVKAEPRYPMTIALASEKESLWNMAKKYKTTCQQISQVNNLEEDPQPGQKILIVR